MAAGRYELNEAQWQRIKDTLPGRVEHVGRTAADNRLFVNAVLWVLRSGARWHDLPDQLGRSSGIWFSSGLCLLVLMVLPVSACHVCGF